MRIFKYLLLVIGLLFCSSDLISANEGWYIVPVPTQNRISKLDFCNSDFGVVITDSNDIFLTIDGGVNFANKKSNFPVQNIKKIYDVKCIKTDEVYVTIDSAIYFSKDSCNTWEIMNNISVNKDTLTCVEIHKYDSICYCTATDNIYYSSNSMKKWNRIEKTFYSYEPYYAYKRERIKVDYYKNQFTEFWYIKGIMVQDGSYLRKYINNKIVNEISFRSWIEYDLLQYVNSIFVNDTSLFIQSSDKIYLNNSYNDSLILKFEKLVPSGGIRAMINDNEFYSLTWKNILRYNGKRYIYNLADTNYVEYIRKIKVINDRVAFAILKSNNYFNDPIFNFFLKTEDGGGVDLSDVEEVIPQNEITQSTHIELYDILGRNIATFPSYEKLRAEIENYPPPHLIKWRDEKGIFHFERMK